MVQSTRPRGLIYAWRYLAGKTEGDLRKPSVCRVIADVLSGTCGIPLKSYLRLRSASSPRLIFQAGPVNSLKAHGGEEIPCDIPGCLAVSPCCLRLEAAIRALARTLYAHMYGCVCFFPPTAVSRFRELSLHFCRDLFRSVTCSFCSDTEAKSHDCTNQFENRYSKLTRHNSHAAHAVYK